MAPGERRRGRRRRSLAFRWPGNTKREKGSRLRPGAFFASSDEWDLHVAPRAALLSRPISSSYRTGRFVAMPTKTPTRAERASRRAGDRKPPTKRLTRAKSEAEQALAAYDSTFLECRDLRHPWAVVGCYRKGGKIVRQLQCRRCPTTRFQTLAADGRYVGNRYEYPDGYLISGLDSPVSTKDVRRHVLSQLTIFETEDQMLNSLFAAKGRRTAGKKRSAA